MAVKEEGSTTWYHLNHCTKAQKPLQSIGALGEGDKHGVETPVGNNELSDVDVARKASTGETFTEETCAGDNGPKRRHSDTDTTIAGGSQKTQTR